AMTLGAGPGFAKQGQAPAADAPEAGGDSEAEAPDDAPADAAAAPEAYAGPADGVAAEASDEESDVDPPPPPEPLEGCGAARCLTVGFTPDLKQALQAGEATLDQLSAGLTVTYEGLEPLRAYFVAARYEDDRMVRYDVSEALTIDP